MKQYQGGFFIFLFTIIAVSAFSQTINGRITGESKQPLAFASLLIKGTSSGVSANAEGYYSIHVEPGTYKLVAQHVGYTSAEREVTVSDSNATINFSLPLQQYSLRGVTVTSGSENPAYEVIRNAIKKRRQYEHEIKQLQCDVYIKGRLQLESYPKKFLGQRVDLPGLDTAQKQTLFLSETNARWSVQEPNKEKVEVLSTRLSGNSQGFGLSYPQIISFYHNNIRIGDNLNPRGFVSPIAEGALAFYDYKLDGTFYDNGLMVNHVRVIPNRKAEPLFAGYINIIEGSWRIYSVELSVQKDQQMQYLDLLKIDQIYMPVDSVWVIKQQVIYPAFDVFGFAGYGNFVQIYSHFNLQPRFAKNFFNNVIITYPDSATQKPAAFWDSTRPIPLQPIEVADYKRKDSLEVIAHSKRYIDSVNHIRNKPKILPLLISGQTFSDTKRNTDYFVDAFINTVSYNTVEGANIILSPDITKRWTTNRRSLFISPTIRYGFNNRHFNAHLTGIYTYGKKYQTSFYASGGKRVFQVFNDQPILAADNATSTLFFKSNYMKLYEAQFGRVSFTKEIPGGVSITAYGEYQDRHPLNNTTNFTIIPGKFLIIDNRGKTFSPNYPQDITDSNFRGHQATVASLSLKWQPGSKYIEFPDRFINIGSSYPAFTATFTKGIPNLFGSDINYSKWQLDVRNALDLKLAGRINYHITTGGFIDKKQYYTPDYQHYYGIRSFLVTDYLSTYLLAGFYELSNTSNFYTEAHVEYHLNGFLTNKIPLMRKWNWFFVTGGNGLVYKNRQYAEYYLSIENILKVFRVDFIQAYNPQESNTSGIRLSALFLLTNRKED